MELQERAIADAVKDFIKGGDERDIRKLDAVLHTDYRNFQNGFFEQKGAFNIDKETYLSLIEQKVFGGIPREIRFESIDRVGDIAMVKIHLHRPGLQFISFIMLVKTENADWKVVGNYPYIEST